MSVTINKTPSFELISHHNGEAYTLKHLPSGSDVFVQGDDATEFRGRLDDAPEYEPFEITLGDLWLEYWTDNEREKQ